MNMTEFEARRFRCTLGRNLSGVGLIAFGGAAFAVLMASGLAAGMMMRGEMSIVHVLALLAMAGALGMMAAACEAAYEAYEEKRRNPV